MKVLVKINLESTIDKYINKCDGLILGISHFSVGFKDTFDIEKISKIIEKYSNKDIFISINKSIFNNELEELEKVLTRLNKMPIKGILFYDLSILYLKKKHNFNFDLVWNQTHMVTNYNTCNYYYKNGVRYGFISSEITKEEILEINKLSKMDFLYTIVGHQVMSLSRRSLLTNYYTSISKEYDGTTKEIYEHDNKYLISEDNNGTIIKTSTIFNGIEILPELIENNLSYVVVDEDLIDYNIILNILDIVSNIIQGKNVEKNINKSYELIGNNTSFLYKKTIFKVKKDNK